MGFLDTLIYGYRTIFSNDVEITRRNKLNLIGFTVADNTSTGCTDVTPVGREAVAVSALEIDWSAGEVFTKTLASGGNTFTFANEESGRVIVVRLTSHGSGSTVTWPTVLWAGGTPPTQSTPSKTDVYTFVHDGDDIYGSVVQDMS